MSETKYETAVFRFQSKTEEPAIIIIGGTHGDEPAGFEAAYRLLDYFSKNHPLKGTIYIIAEANKMAVMQGERRIPVPESVEIEAGNLNRCYPGRPNGLPIQRLAYQITEFIKLHQIQLLIDLHESPFFAHEIKSVDGECSVPGQCIIYTGNELATHLSYQVHEQINQQITSSKKKFTLKEGPIKNSAAWLAGEHFNIPGFTIETCKKLPLEERVQFQVAITLNFLKAMEVY
ncbi:succinylglutamate desuccinylase/aspartoacylase family protein [candidate division KSB1 bacterium]|nr:succinylglutamate desuccinylase/aspartoacylase family protein [candidate division KSB1 bacterium]